MKLTFPLLSKSMIGYVFIGNNGVIRFNQTVADILKLRNGDKWAIAYDEDDPTKTFMYFFKVDEGGMTMSVQNKSLLLCAKRFTDFFNVVPHSYYEYEKISIENKEGFRLKIVSNPPQPKKYKKK